MRNPTDMSYAHHIKIASSRGPPIKNNCSNKRNYIFFIRSGLSGEHCPGSGLSFVCGPRSGQVCLLYTVPGQVNPLYFAPGQL